MTKFAIARAVLVVLVSVTLGMAGSTTLISAAEVARYQPPSPPPLSADAVFVKDVTSGTELFALNPDTPLPPASLTKIVSALVMLERADLNDSVEIVAEDLVSEEESQVGLVVGDRLTVRDLLLGVLIPSGNDATRALARHVGAAALSSPVDPRRAIEEFVSLMNDKAHALGATSSHFENPTGIDAEGHVMSARDIAIVTAAALQNPLFAEIVATPSAVLASEAMPDGYSVQTTNALLAEGAVTGVKTGTTPAAGGCLVTSWAVGPNTVVAVVLGSELAETTDGLQDNTARLADTRALLSAVTGDYTWLDPAEAGGVAGLLEELQVWDVGLMDEGLLPVPAAEAAQIRYRLVLQPPTAPREQAGEVQFFVGDRLLSERTAVQAG
ncbi:MAG: D-alanyl-D-alanine carboxypeptidase family protein [Thermomicrobiales bacterium]